MAFIYNNFIETCFKGDYYIIFSLTISVFDTSLWSGQDLYYVTVTYKSLLYSIINYNKNKQKPQTFWKILYNFISKPIKTLLETVLKTHYYVRCSYTNN